MKTVLVLSTLLGALGVAFGALGAHKLQDVLTADQLASWNTAVKYQMLHILLLLILGLSAKAHIFKTPALVILIGIFLFSGSIYLLSTKNLLGIESMAKILGPITPIGGVLLIVGWLLLALKFWKL